VKEREEINQSNLKSNRDFMRVEVLCKRLRTTSNLKRYTDFAKKTWAVFSHLKSNDLGQFGVACFIVSGGARFGV